jgi:diketogulonate reductase-like aldo/keto reductase
MYSNVPSMSHRPAAEKGITTAAYGGLTPIRFNREVNESDRTRIMSVLERLASARGVGVTMHQILLKWIEQQGVIVVTTSKKESRMKEYQVTVDLPDLTARELKAIDDAVEGNSYEPEVGSLTVLGA